MRKKLASFTTRVHDKYFFNVSPRDQWLVPPLSLQESIEIYTTPPKKKPPYGAEAQRVKNLTSIHEDGGSIPGLTQWVKDWHHCELWRRSQIWLGYDVAVAVV